MEKHLRPFCTDNCQHKLKCFFSELNLSSLEECKQNSTDHNFKKNQTIFMQGNLSSGVYCVHSGTIKLVHTNTEGKEFIVRLLTAGDILGHRSLLSGRIHTTSAISMENSIVGFFSKKFILDAIAQYPIVTIRLLKELSDTSFLADSKCVALIHNNVRERLARLLLALKNSHGVQEAGRVALTIKITREEIARIIGSSLETVVRLFSEFKNEGLIALEGKSIYIINEAKLMEFANL